MDDASTAQPEAQSAAGDGQLAASAKVKHYMKFARELKDNLGLYDRQFIAACGYAMKKQRRPHTMLLGWDGVDCPDCIRARGGSAA